MGSDMEASINGGAPIAGWFMMEISIKMDDLGYSYEWDLVSVSFQYLLAGSWNRGTPSSLDGLFRGISNNFHL